MIIIISWSLKCFVTKQRKLWGRSNQEGPAACRIMWKIDVKFQQQRVALHSVGCRELIGGEHDAPFLEEEGPLRLPFRSGEKKLAGREEADTIYIRTAATNGGRRKS